MTTPASASHQDIASTTDTSEDSFTAPGSVPVPREPLPQDAEVARLDAYLHETFPREFRTNRQVPETPVDMAIRLLSGLHAHVAATEPGMRCTEPYCNQPRGHTDAHRWVHFSA